MTKKEQQKVYQQVVEEQPYCQLCGSTNWLEIHHIIYRSHKGKTEMNNLIRLCKQCHEKVHSNKKYWQPILLSKVNNEDK